MSRDLGRKLWKLVEAHQGYAFISDSVEGSDDKTALRLAENALRHQEKLNVKLRAFLKRYSPEKADQP